VAFPRSSGILLHPTSLPGPYGIGDLGPEAYRFAGFLSSAKMKIWQILPLGPTGYGDSPYQCYSAFAGNPLLISLDRLRDDGLLSNEDLASPPSFPESEVDFEKTSQYKRALLEIAFSRFHANPEFDSFANSARHWLEDFARFMALKEANGNSGFAQWDPSVKASDRTIAFHWFLQFQFFRQWNALREHCHAQGIQIMGDIPIYVAHDSADVWANRHLFDLAPNGEPYVVAGVPPDYFSATGQLWGNPIYRWDQMRQDGFTWWIERFRATFQVVDIVRLDHFRGFEAFWEVPAGETTAVNGRWVKAPGIALFEALQKALGTLPIVAENLGVITKEGEALRHRFGFPGMSILQFAFGKDAQGSTFKPHNFPREVVAYTGTHDNDTTVGWWTSSGAGESTRTAEDIEEEHAFCRAYLNTDGHEIHWDFIRALMASVANTVLVPLQDVLGLGSEARMNLPGGTHGYWRWRLKTGELKASHAHRLKTLADLYER
jgi:4-alpha-glucanotransferase